MSRLSMSVGVFLVLFCLLLPPVAAHGTETADPEENQLSAGLQFLIAGDFTLRPFDGSLLSWRWRSADGNGWRFGVSLSGSISDQSQEIVRPDTSYVRSADTESFTCEVSAQRLFGRRTLDRPSLYLGFGPVASWRQIESTNIYSTSSSRSSRVGVRGTIGAEWRVLDAISLHAEYNLDALYEWEKLENSDNREPFYLDSRDTDGFRLDTREVRFGLTAWFK